MKTQLANNAARRRQLLEKIREQRIELSEISETTKSPLALVDTGVKAIRFLYSNPKLTGGVAALFALRRKSILGIALEGWRFMYLYPSILSIGLKYLPRLLRSTKKSPPIS